MRIKLKLGSEFPMLVEVTKMLAVLDTTGFKIIFEAMEGKCYQLTGDISTPEAVQHCYDVFRNIQTTLGLNGYVNLCPEEQTSLIGEDWDIKYFCKRIVPKIIQ